jgi:NADH-quinone oxidoreductase subunit N
MTPGLNPELAMGVGVLVTLVVGMATGRSSRLPYWIALATVLAALVASVLTPGSERLLDNAVLLDAYSLVVNVFVLLAAIAGLVLAWDPGRYGPEYPALVLLAALGAMLMGLAANLLVLFLGIELLSLPLYVLAGSERTPLGAEAGIKYLLVGAFSSGILLFGMALLYGATGTLVFVDFAALHAAPGLLAAGVALTVAGLIYKLAIVPFHMWVPDVYEGSPTPVTTFMAFATKVAAAAALLRVLAFGFPLQTATWGVLLGYFAVLTMLVGNLLALPQRDLKRLLAWSGVGNAGYVLVGIASHDVVGAQAAIFYLLPYGLAVVAAFAAVRVLEGTGESVQYNDLRGVAWRHPALALAFLVAMLSLAGIPLTGGFVGKFVLLRGALADNQWGLAIGLVVATLVGLAVYFRPVQAMFQRGEGSRAHWSVGSALVLGLSALATVGLGVFPQPVLHMVSHSATFPWLH